MNDNTRNQPMPKENMLNITIEKLLRQAVATLQIPDITSPEAGHLLKSERTREYNHGDISSNVAMRLAKNARQNPKQLAATIIDQLPDNEFIERVEIAGPGFINFFFRKEWLAKIVYKMASEERANISKADTPMRVVVDYSAPNVAKEMHVGHIRSTIIGDTMARTLEFLGHTVIRANHIGDWGTQFGMLIAHLEEVQSMSGEPENRQLKDLEIFYREAKRRYDTDETFSEQARNYVVRLQGGDEWCLSQWETLVDITMSQNQLSYDRLGVSLSRKDTMGESLYNHMLPMVVDDLVQKGIANSDQGAVVVFLDKYKTKDGAPMGVIVQKKDGAFLYTTTDIACVKYRYDKLHAERIIYCIDSRQAQHLDQAWTIARLANYLPEAVKTEHLAFGMILGTDGKPFKTREGGTVKLSDLLEEAHSRAANLVEHKNPDLSEAALWEIAEAVAIGAIKYADLSKNRTTDYVFDWDNMLSFDGNTAPYLQYANTRIHSILDKAEFTPSQTTAVIFTDDTEILLARHLVWFGEVLTDVSEKGLPHLLCNFLYDLARQFTRFYETCPINRGELDLEIRSSRLTLCLATTRVLEIGFSLLGIHSLRKM